MLAIAAAVAVGIIVALIWPITDLVAAHDTGLVAGAQRASQLQAARESVRTQLLTLGAGVLAAGALLFTALNTTLSRRTFILAEQGQVTDRYTRAIEQLGSDKLDVRIGAIYALERVAHDSARDHPTVMEVLAAFVREHSREPWPLARTGDESPEPSTCPDVQAAVTVIGRRNPVYDRGRFDFTGADLTRANLNRATFNRAIFIRANLTGADLEGADVAGADLEAADLTGADLTGADLTGADIAGADLTGADLIRADLTRADLSDSVLTDADLMGARFRGGSLFRATLAGAILASADLTDASLMRADFTGADLINADLAGADLAGATLTDADLTGAKLTGADLTGASLIRADFTGADLINANLVDADLAGATLTDADLTGVMYPEDTLVPEGWVRNPGSGRLDLARL
jgi:uncharacterized protein YjbI with pentapeptide repeats